jgi:vacuolar protein-sorting-associated protein 4
MPTLFPQLFTGKRKPFKGILLYGPPGTGKSFLAKAVATEADSTFFSVSSADLISKWQGESERLVRQLFEMARESGKAIIFIDEVDSLCGSRSEGESDSLRRVKTEFLVQMDGVGNSESQVLVLGATNIPWELDAAIRRRFEKRVYIPLPEAESRAYMVRLNLGDTPNDLTESDFEKLGEITEGSSGSDIKVLVKEALMEPLRRCQQAKQFYIDKEGFYHPCDKYPNCSHCPPKLSTDKPGMDYTCKRCGAKRLVLWDVPPDKLKAPMVRRSDFEKVMRHASSTVSPEELKRFVEWTKLFGQDGA